MPTRWLIRLVVLVSVLLLGAMADAQQTSGTNSQAPAPAPRIGTRGAAPAPKPAPAPPKPAPAPTPAPVNGSGNTGGATTTPPTNNGSGGSVSTGTGSTITGTGAPISQTPAPITQTPAPAAGNPTNPPTNTTADQRDNQRHHRHRPRNPNDPNNPNNNVTYILPQQYGWAPYTWWFNGNSAWMPTVLNDGYYDNDYYDDNYRAADDADRYDRVAPPATPPTTPSPTQEQARAANSVEGMPAYNQAMVEFKAAQAAYDDAVARVMDRLRRNPEYQRLVAQRDRADDRVEAVQAGARIQPSASNPERVLPAAQQKLQISTKVTKMEQDAIAADPQASAAKAKLVEANEKLTALRKQAGASGGQAR